MKRLLNFFFRSKQAAATQLPNPLEFVYLNWNKLGKDDPLWAISSQADKKDGKWALDDFFAEGTGTIQFVFDEMKANGVEPQAGSALDFGCGVGRLTQALAARFSRVDGVDIADTMIENARRFNRFPSSCNYHVNQQPDLSLFPDNSFDFVFTLITLQHIPREFTKKYLQEFIRVASPGGVIYFQLPARRKDGIGDTRIPDNPQEALEAQGAVMIMNGVPRADVEELVARAGAKLRYVVEDPWSGAEWESYRYCLVKN